MRARARLTTERTRALPALLLAVAACATSGGSGREVAPRGAPSVSSAPAGSISAASMLRHELLGVAVRDAVIRGDLPAARRDAFQLAGLDIFASGPPDYEERAVDFRHTASSIVAAEDIRTAAYGVGELAKACSGCHARLTGPTRIDVQPVPLAKDDGPRGRMHLHAWAMNELWNGMIGNSEPPWRAGTALLADADPGTIELAPEKRSSASPVHPLATSMRDLGQRAALASDPDVRASIYGELLATCASCHRRMR